MARPAQSDTRSKTGRLVLQCISLLVVLLIAFFSLKFTVVAQFAQSDNMYLDMSSKFQTDPDVLAGLAHREHITGDLDKAHLLYLRALNSFILHPPAWLGLAKLLQDLGQTEQAVAALQALDNLQIDTIDLVWQKALLAHALHQHKILLPTLNRLAEYEQVNKIRVFNLAGQTWDDPLFLLQNFKVSQYPHILQFYIRTNQLKKARIVWQEFDKTGFQDSDTTNAYVSFLLNRNKFDLALTAWRESFQKNGALLYNGNFEHPVINAGFGWRVSGLQGVSLQYDEIFGGLTITFDGTKNDSFMLSQIVPLMPGEHIFQGTFETTDLTSEERPYWLISGYNCKGLHIADTMLPPSEYETEFVLPFSVPDSCKAIKIDFIRNKANIYDSLISGNVILKNLEIKRLSPDMEEQTKAEEPQAAPPAPPAPEPEAETAAPPEKENTQVSPIIPSIQKLGESTLFGSFTPEKPQAEVPPAPVQEPEVETEIPFQTPKTEHVAEEAYPIEPHATQEVHKPTTITVHSLIVRD